MKMIRKSDSVKWYWKHSHAYSSVYLRLSQAKWPTLGVKQPEISTIWPFAEKAG